MEQRNLYRGGPRLLGIASLALALLIAGMIWRDPAGDWIMAAGFAFWVVGLAISGSAFDAGTKRIWMAIGVFLCAGQVLSALQLTREPIVVGALFVALAGIVIADRIWWSRLPRKTGAD